MQQENGTVPDTRAAAPRLVILGAGYGGLHCAQVLSKYLDSPGAPSVVLVDRFNYHQIITELPVAAGGRIGSEEVALALDRLVKQPHVRLEQAEVLQIDLKARKVVTSSGDMPYDMLVVAVGSITDFYNVPGLKEHSLTLKSVEDAEMINARVREAMAEAAREPDTARRAAMLSFLIGGAGLTGVELAGELAEYLPKLAESHGLERAAARVTLVESAPVVLPSMPKRLQTRAATILTNLGVRLILGGKVVEADPQGITLAAGDRLVGNMLVWTGGIMAPPLLHDAGLPTARNGQVRVDSYLRVPEHPGIYVIGDAALISDQSGGSLLQPTAQVAVKQAEAAAYNIVASWEGWQPRPYSPEDKGQVVSLGAKRGVASVFNVSLTGRKVIALKSVIEEAYRYSVTGRIGASRG